MEIPEGFTDRIASPWAGMLLFRHNAGYSRNPIQYQRILPLSSRPSAR